MSWLYAVLFDFFNQKLMLDLSYFRSWLMFNKNRDNMCWFYERNSCRNRLLKKRLVLIFTIFVQFAIFFENMCKSVVGDVFIGN